MKKLFRHTKRPEKRGFSCEEWDNEEEFYAGEAGEEEEYYAEEAEAEEETYYAEETEAEEEAYYAEAAAAEEEEEYYAGAAEAEEEAYYAEATVTEEEEEYYAEAAEAEEKVYYAEAAVTEEEEEYYAGAAEAEEEAYYAEAVGAEEEVYYAVEAAGSGASDVGADDYFATGEILYEDEDLYNADYRGEQTHTGRAGGRGAEGRLFRKLWGMPGIEKVTAAVGAAVLVMALATGLFLVSSMASGSRETDVVSVGAQLKDIELIGGKGLLAVADAQIAKQEAASMVQEPEETPSSTEEEDPDYTEADYSRKVSVEMNMTSIQKDLKIKFTNKETGKLVANVPFAVTVTDPDGKSSIWSDDDMDGIIYKKDITPGKYKIAMEKLTDEKYADFSVSTETKSVEVKKNIAYEKVDVGNEVKKESQVNVKKEDTVKHETVVESVLQDTVAWVESTAVGTSYTEIPKSEIADPMAGQTVAGILDKKFLRTAQLSVSGSNAGQTKPAPLAKGTLTASPASLSIAVKGTGAAQVTAAGFTAGKTLKYAASSSNAAVAAAAVDAAGRVTVTGVAAGSAQITVTVDYTEGNGSTAASAVISVTVGGSKSIELSSTAVVAFVANPLTLSASIRGAATAAPVVAVESGDTAVLKAVAGAPKTESNAITVPINLEPLKEGSATLTVKCTENGETVTASCTVTVKQNPREDKKTKLLDKQGRQLYVEENGVYREAVYQDYYTKTKFYLKGDIKYTGWQTLNGQVYYYTTEGKRVTGEQIIQGAKYTFASDGALVTGNGAMGIDVSKWNGKIDWSAVKNSGVGYAIIRCGYRGSSQGALIEDSKFKANIKGASEAGLKVGVYFFTQAVDEREAVEEASMVLDLVKNYKISYPIFLDVEGSGGRADAISKEVRTAVCRAFCETIQKSGYTAGIYANRTWLQKRMDAAALGAYKIWLAQYSDVPTYDGRYDLWQYRSTGRISGINGDVDLNMSYLGY